MTYYDMVSEFHEKFDLKTIGFTLPDDVIKYRLSFIEEELEELRKAYADQNPEEILDALVDIVYVCLGTSYFHGFDFDEAFARVHRANLSKQRATDPSQSKRGSQLDLVKPPGWVKPNLADLVS